MNTQEQPSNESQFSLVKLAEVFKNLRLVTMMAKSVDPKIVRFFLIATLLGTFFQAAGNAVYAYGWEQLGQAASLHEITGTLMAALVLMSLLNVIPSISRTFRDARDQRFSLKASTELELRNLHKYDELDPARIEQPEFQDIVQKASERGINPLQRLFRGQFQFLGALAGAATSLVVLLVMKQGLLVLMVGLGAIPALIAKIRYSNDTWSIHEAEAPIKRRYYDLRYKLTNTHSLGELKVFQSWTAMFGRITDLVNAFMKSQEESQRRALRAQLLANLIEDVTMVTGMLLVVVNGIYGNWKVSAIIFAISSIRQLQGSVEEIRNNYADLYDNSLFVDNFRRFHESKPLIVRSTGGLRLPAGKVPHLAVEDLSFAYAGSDEMILKGLSLEIRPGEIVGLVGDNGAGKTTLTKLIAGIYKPTAGRVLLDGCDLEDYDIESWRSSLAIMAQMYMQYNFSIEEAIAFGRADHPHDQARVLEAARLSQADRFIEKLPDGYRTQLGAQFAGGKDLSRGQNQRLTLARVFYRNAAFIVLDEPTAATAAKAEAEIFDTIYRSRGRSSAIIITHNFANVMMADRICVLDGGRIAESGTHRELMKRDGLYAVSFRAQAERFNPR